MQSVSTHSHVTNLSGNEIYCLNKLSFTPGNICIGNSVFALGILGSLTAGLNILVGGEIPDVTGLIEFLAIGTAVKKMDGIATRTPALIPQAIIRDRDTFFDKPPQSGRAVSLTESGKSSASATQGEPIAIIISIVMFAFYILVFVLKHH